MVGQKECPAPPFAAGSLVPEKGDELELNRSPPCKGAVDKDPIEKPIKRRERQLSLNYEILPTPLGRIPEKKECHLPLHRIPGSIFAAHEGNLSSDRNPGLWEHNWVTRQDNPGGEGMVLPRLASGGALAGGRLSFFDWALHHSRTDLHIPPGPFGIGVEEPAH